MIIMILAMAMIILIVMRVFAACCDEEADHLEDEANRLWDEHQASVKAAQAATLRSRNDLYNWMKLVSVTCDSTVQQHLALTQHTSNITNSNMAGLN